MKVINRKGRDGRKGTKRDRGIGTALLD